MNFVKKGRNKDAFSSFSDAFSFPSKNSVYETRSVKKYAGVNCICFLFGNFLSRHVSLNALSKPIFV